MKQAKKPVAALEIDLIRDDEYRSDNYAEFPSTATASSRSKNSPTGTSSLSQAIFNLSNTIVGAGIIGLPYGLKRSGLVLGLLLMMIVAGLTNYSLRLLIRTAVRHRKTTYEDLVFLSFGNKGVAVVAGARFLFSAGGMVSYLIILGDTISAVMDAADATIHNETTTRRVAIGTASLLFLLPLVLLRDITSLSHTSVLSIGTVAAIELVVLGQAAAQQHSLFKSSCNTEDHLVSECSLILISANTNLILLTLP
jgi:sodium-coupled neutral amino acid transporter 11